MSEEFAEQSMCTSRENKLPVNQPQHTTTTTTSTILLQQKVYQLDKS